MASHRWKTVTRWKREPWVALARAQEEVFQRGEYGGHYFQALAAEAEGRPLPALPALPAPRDIDAARAIWAEEGTGSILDVHRLAPAPAMAATGPFAAEVLREVVGAEAPTLAEVEAALDGLYARLGRGESGYVVCHTNGAPTHVVFLGRSLD